jgi:type I restriction enzyme S subunit
MKLNIDRTNWKKVKLGDVAIEYSKRVNNPSESTYEKFVGSANIEQWDFRVKSWEKTDSVISAMKAFEKDDYLIVRRSLYASDFRERAPRAHFDGVCSGDIITIKENPQFISDGFLIAVLNHPDLWKYVVANASGSITRRIKWNDLANYEFLLPPKEEQAKLAELLWAMDEVIEKEKAVLAAVINAKKSARNKFLLGEGNSVFTLGNLFSSWKFTILEKNATVKGRIGWRGLKQSEYVENGPYLVAGKHINEGEIDWNICDMITLERYEESMEIALREGDVIFSKDGAIGNPALVRKLPKKATINSTMMLIRPNKNLDSEYLYQILQSVYFERLKYRCLSGSAIPHIFQGDMKKFEFPLPPLDEQQNIGRKLREFDMNIDKVKDRIYFSKNVQKSLINQIF